MNRWRMYLPVVAAATLISLCSGTGTAQAEDLYRLKLAYEARPDSQSQWSVVDRAELDLRAGMSGSAFLGDASVILVVATAGRDQYLVDLTLTTLPPRATVVTRQFVLEKGRPIEVAGLKYERAYDARVMIGIHPHQGELDCDFGSADGARTVDEFISDIPFHGAPSMLADTLELLDDQVWYADPSAHFELYFIPNTLGDFGWNLVRDYLEREYEQFDNVFHLGRSQRVHYFIAPCRVPEIAWTPHRSWAVNPTTFKAYAVFNRDEKSVSGIPTNLNHIYRYLGYAPMVLAEGAARGFEYDHYYAKKLKWRGRLPRPSEHWVTARYKAYPDSGLYIAAGSFVNYLIGTRGLNEFFKLYAVANDFNADSAFTSVFGVGLRDIEDQWLHFLDTTRVYPHAAQHFVGRAKLLGRNQESIELLKVLIDVDTTDVSQAKDELALLHFLEGEYDEAVEVIGTMSDRYTEAERVRQMGSAAHFFAGHLDSARAGFESLLDGSARPITQSAAALMYGWLELTEGNFAKADSLFDIPDPDTRGAALDQVEIALHRARIRRMEDRDGEADSLLRQALNQTFFMLQSRPGAGDLYLRIGESYVGMGEPDTALIYLDVAEFLEYRPYYLGRVLVATGNAYDLLGMRDFAERYYRRALDVRTSYPARVEARRYLRKPYRVERNL